jgi:hypothetical protein
MIMGYCSGCGKPIHHACDNVAFSTPNPTGYCTRCGDPLPAVTAANVHVCNLAKFAPR